MIGDVLAKLSVEFPDGPPNEDQVRAQRVSFYPRHWLAKDQWPERLNRPLVLAEQGIVSVSRQELFDMAQSVPSDDAAVSLYVHIAGWGIGTKARGAARVAKPLQDLTVGAKLAEAHGLARAGDPVQAYAAMNHGGPYKLRHFGPAFFTKWLYFGGYETAVSQHRTPPLILDARVARALGWRTSGWAAAHYQRYLDLAEEIRAAWCPSAGLHVVEFGLFRVGGNAP